MAGPHPAVHRPDERVQGDQFLSVPIWDPANVAAVQTVIPTFICPSDGVAAKALLGGQFQVGIDNPGKSMGLWYPASMGPTCDGYATNVSCAFCPGRAMVLRTRPTTAGAAAAATPRPPASAPSTAGRTRSGSTT